MRKRVLLLTAVVLALATTAPAASFWAGLLTNGAFRWGSTPDSNFNMGSNANSGGIQYASTQGTNGGGLVLQAEGAAGFQDEDEDSQEQGMIAGMGQLVANAGDGSSVGFQAGGAGQTQTSDVGTQSQYVGGIQYAYVSGTGVATQTAVVLVYQNQEEVEAP